MNDLGQHFTPPALAQWLTQATLEGWTAPAGPLRVLDPACGPGGLLQAVREVWTASPLQLTGIDLDPVQVQAAQQHLPEATFLTGDALAMSARGELPDESADLVLLNPPYLGEKGRAALFSRTAALGPRLAARSVARMDYLYYFIHLALDVLAPGGRMMALTTAYWPSATSAHALRRDLAGRAKLLRWIKLEGHAAFTGATGQDNLALILEKAPEKPSTQASTWTRLHLNRALVPEVRAENPIVVALPEDGSPWNPFVDSVEAQWAQQIDTLWSTCLSDLVQDRQGVVSGCDRVTARHLRVLGPGCSLQEGDPAFVLTGDELRARGWDQDPDILRQVRPLLRGSSILPWSVLRELPASGDPDTLFMIYLRRIDTPHPSLLTHLAPLRPLLEARREVKQGKIPWWSLHWPRRLEDMLAPKLVTARRGAKVAVALDLAGHVVSSDCTYLCVSTGEGGILLRLWKALHLPETERYLRARGKKKRHLLEFYSQPLRSLRLPLDTRGGWLNTATSQAAEAGLRACVDPDTLTWLSQYRQDKGW